MAKARLMITDNGPHPPAKWALETAKMVFDLEPGEEGPKLDAEQLIDAHELQAKIARALVPHHHGVQHRERGHLKGEAGPRLARPHLDNLAEARAEAAQAIADIQQAAQGTPWQAHFARPDVVAAISDVVSTHFLTAKDVEHRWHRDRAAGRAPALAPTPAA